MNLHACSTPDMPWLRVKSGPARILVLEKNDRSRSRLVGELVVAGWDVLHAASPEDALVAWVGSRRPIDLVIVDPFTTGDAGLRLGRLLRSVQADLAILLWAPDPDEAEIEPATAPVAERNERSPLTREVRRRLGRSPAPRV